MSTDAELLQAWRAGDGDAGEELFERHFVSVVRFLRNKVDGPIDDLVQRVFLGCVEGRDRVREDAGFRAYLFGVARNVLGKYWRERAKKVEPLDLEQDSICDLGATPTSVYARDREQLRVLNALRRLPLDAQLILELTYWESLTAAQIAVVLDVPLGTAKTRIRRARTLLTERMGDLEAGRLSLHTTGTGLETWARGIKSQLSET